MAEKNKFILTLSCKDTTGIVAAVSGFLAKHHGFILESAQFGDASTKRFFMRSVFLGDKKFNDEKTISEAFTPIAKKFRMDWQLQNSSKKPRLLLMVSKLSHCLNDLLHRYSNDSLPVEIPAIVSNHQDMQKMANWYEIPYYHLPVGLTNRSAQEEALATLIDEHNIDLIVLARYMQVLSPKLAKDLSGKAINIHHSFLPSFKGAKPYHQAYDGGVKLIGATAHYITDKLDEGPIIEQEVIRVDHTHTPDQMITLGHDIERTVLYRAVKYHIEHRVILNGDKTVVFK